MTLLTSGLMCLSLIALGLSLWAMWNTIKIEKAQREFAEALDDLADELDRLDGLGRGKP